MNVLIANPIEDAVEKCITHPKYRVGIMVSDTEEKYFAEEAIGKAVFSAYFKRADGRHQFTRFRKSKYGFICEFIEEGSIIECFLKSSDTVRGRRYNMLISTNEFDERTRIMVYPYRTYEFAQSKRESDNVNKD